MDIQSLLTYLFDVIAFGYVALMMLDLGNCLSGGLLDIIASSPTAPPLRVQPATTLETPPTVQPAATTTNLRVSAKCASKVLLSASQAESKPLAFKTPTVEDPWLIEVELTTQTCCCHTATFASPPQLLLSPALEVANQPELATMPSSQRRKLCSERGIKWRGVHGGKHLSKPEMLAALGG